jgi:putative exporter of polyketide antibiotics
VTCSTKPDPLARHRLTLSTPAAWPVWPFLPVVRRTRGDEELGVLFDAFGLCRLTGLSASVFLTNLFTLPPTLSALLALPREVFDTVDELVAAGWRVD